MVFRNRAHAGQLLAQELMYLKADDPIVIGLVRGGVVVAAEVARELSAPLDLLCARKIGAPWQPEAALGAVAPGDIVVFNHPQPPDWTVSPQEMPRLVLRARMEMERQMRLYRDAIPELPLLGETVIVVDDGLATGMTALAAVRSVRAQSPRAVIVAAPVAASPTVEMLAEAADRVVAVSIPEPMNAVGAWYDDFRQVCDDEVLDLLYAARYGDSAAHPVNRFE